MKEIAQHFENIITSLVPSKLLLTNCLDRQPLLDALPACGSENCIALLSDLMRNKELEVEQAHAFLTTIALIPHPSPQTIGSINVGTSARRKMTKTAHQSYFLY